MQIYAEAQARYGGVPNEELDKLKLDYPKLLDNEIEDIWLEEQLAEDFRRYVQYKVKDKSLTTRLIQFFRNLWNAIFVASNNPLTIDKVYENIHNGKYANRVTNHRFNYQPLASRVAGFNPIQQRELVEFIDGEFNNFVNEYREVEKKKVMISVILML